MERIIDDQFWYVGCGVIAPSHAREIKTIKEANLLAVCDILPEKEQKMAKEFNVPYFFTEYTQMLELEELDVINICTPSGLHSEHTILAARAGKHVLCEKPLDVTKEKMNLMINECRKNNVKLGCILQRRAGASAQKIKAALSRGELGEIVLADAYLKYLS